MVQTGDPSGTGKGGQSIWGEPFPDEVRSTLKVSSVRSSSLATPVNATHLAASLPRVFQREMTTAVEWQCLCYAIIIEPQFGC